MFEFIIKILAWAIFGAFLLTIIVAFVKLLLSAFSNPKQERTIVTWENEQGKKGTIYIEARKLNQTRPKRRKQRPKWLSLLLDETPASLMEKRRHKKQRRNPNT